MTNRHPPAAEYEELTITSRRRPRVEVEFCVTMKGSGRSGIQMILSRKGIELTGWYDSFVGLEPGFVDWETFDKYRERLK